MDKIYSFNDFLMEELADLLSAESQLVEILPKMADASQSVALRTALEDCWEMTKEHASRLQDIFNNIGQDPSKRVCKAIQGFIEGIEDILYDPEEYPARDTAIIKVAQRVQQYEITRYKSVGEHAADLGHTRIVELFTKTLNEQRAMNFYLNELAQGMINVQVTGPKSPDRQTSQQKYPPSKTKNGGFYILKGKFGRRDIKKKNRYTLSIVFGALALLVWPKLSYADGGHHGTHQYYHYHDSPHYGLHVAVFYPDEYFPVWAGGVKYYYDDGIYYDYSGGSYVVVTPPVGAVVSTIPVDFKPVFINGVAYLTDNGIYYVHSPSGYQVVAQPVQAAHVMVVNTPNVVTVNVSGGDRGAGFTIAN